MPFCVFLNAISNTKHQIIKRLNKILYDIKVNHLSFKKIHLVI